MEGAGVGEVLLSGVFSLLKTDYDLTLTRNAELRMRRQDSSPGETLRLSECIGCYAFQGKDSLSAAPPQPQPQPQPYPSGPPTPPAAAYFTLFCYPLRKGWWDSGEARHRVAKTFRVLHSPDPERNRAVAETWARKIRDLSLPRGPELEGIQGLLPRPCHVMVLLNPHAGSGRALQQFNTQVQPMLREANIAFTVFITENHNHAWELMKQEDLSKWDALVAMAGDGLLYEMLNGVMERPDWASVIQKPFCILPGGSGNALAASLDHYARNGPCVKEELLMTSTYFLCKGLHSPMDLVSLWTASGKRLFSFLSFGWGFVSDVDIASERYRKLGSVRFTVGTFQLLTTLQIYKGRLSYLPAEEPSPSSGGVSHPGSHHSGMSVRIPPHTGLEDYLLVPFDRPVPKYWTTAPDEEFVSIVVIYQSHLGADLVLAPTAKLYDDAIHLFYVTAGVSRMAMIRFFMALDKGTHLSFNNPHLHYVPIKAFRLEPLVPKGLMTVDGEVIPCEPVQGQVHRRLARVISGF